MEPRRQPDDRRHQFHRRVHLRPMSMTPPTRRATADFLNDRVRAMPPSGIRRFFDMLAEMKDVISLTIGEPDFDTPGAHHARRHRQPRARRDALHRQRRHDRAPRADRGRPRAALRRGVRPADRADHHGGRLGGGRRQPAGDPERRRRGHLPRALLRGLRTVHRARRRPAGRGQHDRCDRLPASRRP